MEFQHSAGSNERMDPLTFARNYGLRATLQCQDRVIRRDQALAVGIREPTLAGLLRRGRWERILPRVFAVGVDVLHPLVRVRSAWLWAGDDSVIGGEAAAWWLGLREDPPGLVNPGATCPADDGAAKCPSDPCNGATA